MADLGAIKFVEREVKITHPGTGKYVGLKLTLVSVDDPSLKAERRRIADRRMYLADRGKSFKAEEIEENQFSLLNKAIRKWEWEEDEDGEMGSLSGEQLEYNRASLRKLFDAAPWIKEQVTQEFTNTEDFFGN